MEKQKSVSFENIEITDGFWAEKQRLVRDVSNLQCLKRFEKR